MAGRQYGQGSVVKSGTMWRIRLSEGSDDQGRRVRRYVPGVHDTREAAEAALGALQAPRNTQVRPHQAVTQENSFSQLVERWLRVKGLRVKANTLERYEGVARVNILPRFGHLSAHGISRDDIEDLYTDLSRDLSVGSVRKAHFVLSQVFRYAQVKPNPMDSIEPPRTTSATKIRPLSQSQTRQMLASMDLAGEKYLTLWTFLFSTGVRRSEALGLRWEYVDLEVGRASIVETLVATKDGPVFGSPKTARSRRSIVLDPHTVETLRRHREEQDKKRTNPGWVEHGLVFPNRDGKPWDPAQVTQRWKAVARRHGHPDMRLHDTRHTMATVSLEAGVHPKMVSDRLGHSKVGFTLDTYSHIVPGLQEGAAATIGNALFGD
jgi:integrase